MICLGTWVRQLPPWVPQEVVETVCRVRGYPATGEPLPVSSGINVIITLLVTTIGCVFAYFWWITRPLVVDCTPQRTRFTPPRPPG